MNAYPVASDDLLLTALQYGPEHFGITGIAALRATNRSLRNKATDLLLEVDLGLAQRLLLQAAEEAAQPSALRLLRPILTKVARNLEDEASWQQFYLALTTKLASCPNPSRPMARMWLESGVHISDAALAAAAAARNYAVHPQGWVYLQRELGIRVGPTSYLEKICLGLNLQVR
jgi:hypothetical protein